MLIKKLCKPIFVLIIVSLFLVGCWDKTELENRGFILSIGIDAYKGQEGKKEDNQTDDNNEQDDSNHKDEDDQSDENNQEDEIIKNEVNDQDKKNNQFSLTMTMPNLEDMAGKGDGNEESTSVKVADDKTVSGAMHLIDSSSSRKLYFGHAKLAVIGVDVLANRELFKETVDALERNKEISKKIIVMATQDTANKVLNVKVSDEPRVGMFVSNYYKNNSNGESKAFRSDLSTLIRDLRETGNAILPDIEVNKKEVKIGGSAVIKNFQLVDFLNEKDTVGFLWIKDATKNTQLTIKDEGAYIPLRITESKSNLEFKEVDGKLTCYITVSVKGSIEEYKFSDDSLYNGEKIEKLTYLYEDKIRNEILNTAEIFQKQLKVDGFGFKQNLRKFNYDLFLKYEHNWDEIFPNIEIRPFTEVEIVNTGAVK